MIIHYRDIENLQRLETFQTDINDPLGALENWSDLRLACVAGGLVGARSKKFVSGEAAKASGRLRIFYFARQQDRQLRRLI